MSSRGQIVIPQDMRENILEGEKLIIIKNEHQLILEKVKDFDEKLEEDIEFAVKTEEARKQIEKGEGNSFDSAEEFFEELKKW